MVARPPMGREPPTGGFRLFSVCAVSTLSTTVAAKPSREVYAQAIVRVGEPNGRASVSMMPAPSSPLLLIVMVYVRVSPA